jgi:hypothetical protein
MQLSRLFLKISSFYIKEAHTIRQLIFYIQPP